MGQILGPVAVPDLNGRVHPFSDSQRGRLGGWSRRLSRHNLLGSGSLLGLLLGPGVDRDRCRGRRFYGHRFGSIFRGDRLNRGVNLGWNSGRQMGNGRFRRWGCCCSDRLGGSSRRPSRYNLLGSFRLLPGLLLLASVDHGRCRGRKFCGHRFGGLFRGDRLNRGVNLGWSRGSQMGNGRFRRWGCCCSDRLGGSSRRPSRHNLLGSFQPASGAFAPA